jgi:hypothetical protein
MVVFTILVPIHSVRGQSPGDPTAAREFIKACDAYGESQVVFVGRVEPPVTFHISGEPEIEKARQNVIRTEAEVARLRASLDVTTSLEREAEFRLRIIQAKAELNKRRAIYPPPYDLTLIPVSVERVLRGATEPTLMLRRTGPAMKMEPGELYLIRGYRWKNLIPPFPEMADLGGVDEYIEPAHVTPVALAQHELEFLASSGSGATIMGTLRMHSFGDLAGDPLTGIQIAVSSGTHVVETMTRADGSFIVSGIESGRLEIRPLLHGDLTIVNKSALTIQIGEGGCKRVYLTAALNGRLSGRISSTTGTALDGVTLVLQGVDSSGRMGGSHSPRISVRPNEDGTFEFSGVPPGSYSLSAGLERIEEGRRRYLTTFYPGTPDEAAAVRIAIGKATKHEGFDFLVTTE